MSDQKIRTIVTAEVSEYERGMGAAGKATEEFEKKAEGASKSITALDSVMDRMRDSLGVVGRVLPGSAVAMAAAAAAAFGLASSAARSADEMGRMAHESGVSVEAMSELSYAAKVTDVSSTSLSSALGTLRDKASGGSAELEAMGIKTRDLAGQQRPLADVFQEVIGKLGTYKDDANRAKLAQDVLGRSFSDLLPLMDKGASGLQDLRTEASEYGKVISEEAAAESRAFREDMSRLTAMIPDLVQVLGGPLVGALRSVAEEFLDARKAGLGFMDSFARNGNPLASTAENLDAAKKKLAEFREGLSKPWYNQSRAEFLGGKDELARLEGQVKYFELQLARGRSALQASLGAGSIDQHGRSSAPVIEKPARASRSRQAKEIPLSELDQMYGGEKGGYQRFVASIEAAAANAQAAADTDSLIAENLERQKTKYLDIADPMRQYTRQLEELATLREQVPEQAAQWDAAEARIRESMTQTSSAMDEFAVQAARNIQDTLGDGLYDVLKGNFDDIGSSFADMLTRMAANLAASQVAQLLFGNYASTGVVGGLAGSAGTALRGLLGYADGGVVASPSLSAYSGGVYDRPQVFAFASGAGVFAEAGPEAIMPLARTSSGKLGVQTVGSGGSAAGLQSVRVEIVNNGQPMRVESATPRFDAEGLVVSVFLSDWRNNGPMRQAMGA